MTFFLSVILGILVASMYEYFMLKVFGNKGFIVWGYRLHHSLYSVFLITIGFLLQNIFCIGLGIGILIQHTFTDGFRLVSKEK